MSKRKNHVPRYRWSNFGTVTDSDCSGPVSPPVGSVLVEADNLIYAKGDRSSQYGPAREDYGRAVALYMILCGSPYRMETPEDGLLFMLCVKLSRLAYAFQGKAKWKRDTVVDLCGYASLLHDLKASKEHDV